MFVDFNILLTLHSMVKRRLAQKKIDDAKKKKASLSLCANSASASSDLENGEVSRLFCEKKSCAKTARAVSTPTPSATRASNEGATSTKRRTMVLLPTRARVHAHACERAFSARTRVFAPPFCAPLFAPLFFGNGPMPSSISLRLSREGRVLLVRLRLKSSRSSRERKKKWIQPKHGR